MLRDATTAVSTTRDGSGHCCDRCVWQTVTLATAGSAIGRAECGASCLCDLRRSACDLKHDLLETTASSALAPDGECVIE